MADEHGTLKDVDERGKIPETRLSDPMEVREMVAAEDKQNEKRDRFNALVKGLVDGNPPFRQSDIDKQGQRHRSNFNTGEPIAYLSVALTGFYDLQTEVPTLADVTCTVPVPQAHDWSRIMTEEWDRILRKDVTRDYHNQVSQHDMVLYGSGPMVWINEFDWRPRHARHVDMILPRNAPSHVNELEYVIFKHRFTTSQLYTFMHNEERARQRGWDPDVVKKAIVQASSTHPDDSGTNWSVQQQRLRNADLAHGARSKAINVARVLFREYPRKGEEEGRISEVWVLYKENDPAGFLYKKTARFENWRQCIGPMWYDKGDGTAHSVKGLGVRMYKMLLAKMRLDNATVDSAFARSALMFKATTPKSFAEGNMVHFGPYTILPPEYDFVQVQSTGLLDSSLGVSRFMDNTLSSNLSQFRQRQTNTEGTPKTATEHRIQASQQAQVGKTQISRFYEQRDDIEAESFRRAARRNVPKHAPGQILAQEFRERCQLRGVPPEAFDHVEVKATRAVGQGNPFIRQATLEQMLPQSLAWPPLGRENLLKDLISASAGHHLVPRYYPQPVPSANELDQKSEAFQEHTSFMVGNLAIWTPTQDNLVHATAHVSAMTDVLRTVDAGADPEHIIRFIDAAGPNVIEHLQQLSQDPVRQGEYTALQEQFDTIAKETDRLRGLMGQQQQQEEQNATMNQEAAGRLDIQRKESEGRQRLQEDEMVESQHRKRRALEHDLALDDAKAATEIAREATKSAQRT